MEGRREYCKAGCRSLADPNRDGYCQECFDSVQTNSDSVTIVQKSEITATLTKKIKLPALRSKGSYCGMCNKKLTLIEREMICSCGGVFCTVHQFSKEHNCKYNYKSEASEKIAKSNPKIIGDKVLRF